MKKKEPELKGVPAEESGAKKDGTAAEEAEVREAADGGENK